MLDHAREKWRDAEMVTEKGKEAKEAKEAKEHRNKLEQDAERGPCRDYVMVGGCLRILLNIWAAVHEKRANGGVEKSNKKKKRVRLKGKVYWRNVGGFAGDSYCVGELRIYR